MIDPRLTNEYENEILELIDNQDEYTRSDLQGIVTVLVNKIMNSGYEIIKSQEKIYRWQKAIWWMDKKVTWKKGKKTGTYQ